MAAADEQLSATGFGAYCIQQTANTVTGTERFTRQQIFTENHRFGITAQIQNHVIPGRLLDHAGNDFAFLILELLHHLHALGFTYFLYDNLFGGLGGDTVESNRVDLVFDIIANLDIRLIDLCRFQGDFAVRVGQGFLIFHHLPATIGNKITALAIDFDANRDFAFIFFLGGRSQGGFQCLENLFARHGLFVRNGINNQQYFFIHVRLPR